MRLETAWGEFEVRAQMSGRMEPVDGRYHWSGRISPSGGGQGADGRHRGEGGEIGVDVAALVRAGMREARLEGVPVRLIEVDPWGGVLVRGVKQ